MSETSGGTTTYHLFGPGIDEPTASSRGASIVYHTVDGLGSVAIASDSGGATQNSYIYDGWGITRATTENFVQPFRYTAREQGDVTGQFFYRARFLTPTVGRFLSEDPIKHKSGDLNFYRYVSNVPTKYIDPMGLAATEPRDVQCTNCPPAIEQGAREALKRICRNTRTNGGCASLLRRYGTYDCFRDRCGRAGGGERPINVRCVDPGCGGCGGPCNALSDPTQTIFLQPMAGSPLCGSLAHTVAHEMGHMCGIGPDVGTDAGRQENQRRANAIGDACGGPR